MSTVLALLAVVFTMASGIIIAAQGSLSHIIVGSVLFFAALFCSLILR